MSEEITMNLGASLVLAEVTKMLLFKTITDENGQKVLVDRDIPFKLRYRLNKNKLIFEKDVEYFNQQRLFALAHFGEPDETGNMVVINDETKQKMFKEEIGKLIDSEVTHSLSTLSSEDLELIQDTDMPISPEAMNIFIAYLVDDPDLEKETKYTFQVNLTDNVPSIKKQEVKTEMDEVVTPPENVVKTEEVKPVEEKVETKIKKPVTKKTTDTTKKTTTTTKKTTSEKKTTTKKTTTKKAGK